jgi:hypothetical protein
MTIRLIPVAISIGLLLGASLVRADEDTLRPLRVGEVLPEFSLEDQFGADGRVDDTVRVILFSRDMEGGDFLKTGLSAVGEGVLTDAHVVYVSDISGMPRLVARMFALPKMRKRPYPMLLDRTGEWTALLPGTPGHATFIHLDRLKIRAVEEFDSAEAVRGRIDEIVAGSRPGP